MKSIANGAMPMEPTPTANMDDLIDVCVKHMVNEDFTEEQARSYMKQLLPVWITGKDMKN